MASLAWSRSLSTLFGAELTEESGDAVRQLVDDRVGERVDLEFKREVYGQSKGDPRELALDVAALANAVGGVILLGVDEQDAVASALMPVDDAKRDSEPRRIHEIVAQRVAPIPAIEAEWVAVDGGGVIAIVVPPSRGAPHAVGRDTNPTNRFLCWPRRDGTRKRYMSELEIADAYSVRARQVRRDRERLHTISAEMDELLNVDEARVWLSGAVVPSLPGSFELAEWPDDRQLSEMIEPSLRQPPEANPRLSDVPLRVPRLRRLRLYDGGAIPTQFRIVEMHFDGSVTSAYPVTDSDEVQKYVKGLPVAGGRKAFGVAEVPSQWVFRDLCLVLGSLIFLSTSVAGARGVDSSLRISLNAGGAKIGRWVSGDRFEPSERPHGEDILIERTLNLDAAIDPAGYRALLGSVAADLWNGMGWRTCPYVTREGEITPKGQELLA